MPPVVDFQNIDLRGGFDQISCPLCEQVKNGSDLSEAFSILSPGKARIPRRLRSIQIDNSAAWRFNKILTLHSQNRTGHGVANDFPALRAAVERGVLEGQSALAFK